MQRGAGRSTAAGVPGLADYFEKDEKDFPKHLMLQKAKCVRDAIAAIEASTELPELISVN
jgi:hypothetical protein